MKPDLLVDLAALPPLELDGVLIDFPRLQLWRGDTTLHLTTTEWGLLVLLARHPNQVLSYYQIVCSLWGEASWDVVEIKTVRTYIGLLRRKIEPEPTKPRYLCNSFGVGYRLEVPATWPPRLVTRADLRVIRSEVQKPAPDLGSVPVRDLVVVVVDALTAWLATQDASPALAEREIGGRR